MRLLLLCLLLAVCGHTDVLAGGEKSPTPGRKSSKGNLHKSSSAGKYRISSALRESKDKSRRTTPQNEFPISVQTILAKRRFNMKGLARSLCLVAAGISLQRCIQTAGIPHIRGVWSLIHSDSPMPQQYRPSALDLRLAYILVSSSNESLPPISLPSAYPLLCLLSSLALWIFVTVLLPRWSTSSRVFLEYEKVNTDDLPKVLASSRPISVLVKIEDDAMKQQIASSSEDGRQVSTLLCPLEQIPQIDKDRIPAKAVDALTKCSTHPHPLYFDLNQCRYYFDSESNVCTDGGPTLHTSPLREVEALVSKGLSNKHRVTAEQRYQAYNSPRLALPSLREAFVARVASPLVVIQTVGSLLSCLEEGLSSLANVVPTFLQHLDESRKAVTASRQLAKEVKSNVQDTSQIGVRILKKKKGKKRWTSSTAGNLLPGDVFMIVRPKGTETPEVPVDALLLDGQCLTNEAVLTGESVPQIKTPLDFQEEIADGTTNLDMRKHRNAILFAGTTILHCSSDAGSSLVEAYDMPSHKQSSTVICLALRTGTYSSKGQLLRTLKSGMHVGAISTAQSEKDALRLLASLSAFAVISCISLFIPRQSSTPAKPVPLFRRLVQCTRIISASIPSYIPLALSAVARTCSAALRKGSDVSCSEPGSLLTSAYVDTVVFDKTGTLTADTQSLSDIVSAVPGQGREITSAFQHFVLAGCHSLVQIGEVENSTTSHGYSTVGDPLDLACLKFSGWKYDSARKRYHLNNPNSTDTQSPIRLWQIKTFPFDPTKRLSSALVLSQSSDKSFSLWSLTKGSPEVMGTLYGSRSEENFTASYEKQNQQLEAKGYRIIATGAVNVTNSSLASLLFPNGYSGKKSALRYARSKVGSLRRSGLESTDGYEGNRMIFCGISCFDASVRPSSRRVIRELQDGGIHPIMLTGDAIDAALAVAWQVGLVQNQRKVAILEVVEGNGDTSQLNWRIVSTKGTKKAHKVLNIKKFTKTSTQSILKMKQKGECAIATTGRALSQVVGGVGQDAASKLLIKNLSSVSIFARATPSLKQQVVRALRQDCGRTVMMCGDGVNDVAAMKAADASVALMNGFGTEAENQASTDHDDERRKRKLLTERLGNNRKSGEVKKQRKEARERREARIQAAADEIKKRAAAKLGVDSNSTKVPYSMQDIKDMISASMKAAREERSRERSLKSGGGDAARILAEERRQAANNSTRQAELETSAIKPGEASLVAPFSCLHPSIDGVDAVLRAAIATAACALATQELVALHSLMACFHLATLFRDGFRYGMYMWRVEYIMYMLADRARYAASCVARPRLPKSGPTCRPARSMFHPSCIALTAGQAAIHLLSMAVAVDYGRGLELADRRKKSSLIAVSKGRHPKRLERFLDAIVSKETQSTSSEPDGFIVRLFQRQPFRPNYETNVVFVFSILQSAVTTLVYHKGAPFHRSILESRQLSSIAGLTVCWFVACIGECFPYMNRILELRPWPSRKSKLILLGIAAANSLACFLCRVVVEYFLERHSYDKDTTASQPRKKSQQTAADLEEELLCQESKLNRNNLLYFVMGILILVMKFLVK